MDETKNPTTAEAFASLRRTLKAFTSEEHPVFSQVALLERRMGGMARALQRVDSECSAEDLEDEDGERIGTLSWEAVEECRAILTAALGRKG